MLEKVIRSLRSDRRFMASVYHWEVIPPRKGRYEEFPEEIDGRILAAIRAKGIDRLFSHQAQAYAEVRKGNNIVVVTPTASGKTLAYNLPVLQTLIEQLRMIHPIARRRKDGVKRYYTCGPVIGVIDVGGVKIAGRVGGDNGMGLVAAYFGNDPLAQF